MKKKDEEEGRAMKKKEEQFLSRRKYIKGGPWGKVTKLHM
jgi:hypothetical protein